MQLSILCFFDEKLGKVQFKNLKKLPIEQISEQLAQLQQFYDVHLLNYFAKEHARNNVV
jgi:hypothetical protein